MSLTDNLPHRVTLKRQIRRRGRYIGTDESLETIATGVPCFLQTKRQRDIKEFDRPSMVVTHEIYFKTNYELRPDWEVISEDDGKTYEVRDYADASAGLGKFWKATLKYRPIEATE